MVCKNIIIRALAYLELRDDISKLTVEYSALVTVIMKFSLSAEVSNLQNKVRYFPH